MNQFDLNLVSMHKLCYLTVLRTVEGLVLMMVWREVAARVTLTAAVRAVEKVGYWAD